jgi:hypothetical protein
MGAKFFTDTIDEQFDSPASLADVHVESLLVDEQFPQFPQETPAGSLVVHPRSVSQRGHFIGLALSFMVVLLAILSNPSRLIPGANAADAFQLDYLC